MKAIQRFVSILLAPSCCFCIFSCGSTGENNNCPPPSEILDEISINNERFYLTTDGTVYSVHNGVCAFVEQYFNPDFVTDNYVWVEGIQYALADDGTRIRVKNTIDENFERHNSLADLFISSLADTADNWMDMILQSPAHPTIADYVALRKCILNNTCTFSDNRIDLVENPTIPANHSLKFTAVAPTVNMVTSKCSIENTLFFIEKGDEVYYEAEYYIEEGMPFTLVDLENKWFHESPGIRVMLIDGFVAAELKYGEKPVYSQSANKVPFPTGRWVRLKVNFLMDDGEAGHIKIWQDSQLIIDAKGKTLPTSNSVQTSLEVGITATSQACVMYLDNVKFEMLKK